MGKVLLAACQTTEEDATLPKSNLKWNVQWQSPITLPALTQRLHEEGLGRADLKVILEARSEELTTQLCGPRYHPLPNPRYERAGTKRCILGTRLGKIRVKVNWVFDHEAPEGEDKHFVPLWRDVIREPKKVYQRDGIYIAERGATRMTYRNTNEELGDLILGMPSARTINRRVVHDGAELTQEIHQRELQASTHIPDGTKLHAQKGGKHDVRLILATTPNGEPRLRSITVNKPWEEHASILQRTTQQNEKGEAVPPNTVSDNERGLAEATTLPGASWQPDHIHVVRNTRYALWEDGLPQGEERKSIVGTVAKLLAHLRNSVDYHLLSDEKDDVQHRIKQTTKEFRRLATRIEEQGMVKTAGFLRSVSEAVTTFATLALQGIFVPWHSNQVERLMGEVSKRFKHKWMSWTGRGSEALLTFVAVRAVEPDTFEDFWRRKLYGACAALPGLGVSIALVS